MSIEEENREFRQMLRETWFTTTAEKDRTVVSLSSAAIGVLFIIADKLPLMTGARLALFLGATAAFLASVIAGVWILHENAAIIQRMLNKEAKAGGKLAGWLDGFTVGGFAVGLVLACALTFLYAVESHNNASVKIHPAMSDKENADITGGTHEVRPAGQDHLTASYQKISEIAPPPPPPPPAPPKED